MKIKVIRKQKLTECVNPEYIHSIVPVSGYYGVSLAITMKSHHRASIDARCYNREAYFISLDRFTYHPCMYAAIPTDLYDAIELIEKENEEGYRFIRARITKPVTF